jgi:hypothetical protein
MAGDELDTSAVDAENSDNEQSMSQRLVSIVKRAKYFRTPEGVGYARVEVHGHEEVWRIDDEGYSDWLEMMFFEEAETCAPEKALKSAVTHARGLAKFGKKIEQVWLRTATLEVDGELRIYLDMCDPEWRQIEISASHGVRILNEPKVALRRASGMLALPAPAPEGQGDVSLLREVVNFSSDSDYRLVVAALLGILRPIPQPVVSINGPQGSGKSLGSEILGQLFDPNQQHVSGMPRSIEDMHVHADNSRVVVIDNVSHLSEIVSDELARVSTGAVFRRRTHFKHRQQENFYTRCPLILNGIPEFISRPDLQERTLHIELERISEDRRRTEEEILAEFGRLHPRILRGLLDAAVAGLRRLPTLQLEKLSRMADFHAWAVACETGLGWEQGDFEGALQKNRERGRERLLDASVVFKAILDFMDHRDEWSGTANQLLTLLKQQDGGEDGDDHGWPKTARGMAAQLGRLVTELREEGVEWTRAQRASGGASSGKRDRIHTLRKVGRETESPDNRPHSPHRPPKSDDGGTVGTKGTVDSQGYCDSGGTVGTLGTVDSHKFSAPDDFDPFDEIENQPF